MPNLRWITSPCSVTRRRPLTEPRGEAITARVVLPPPRLIEPPRPWKNAIDTPALCAIFNNSTCAFCSAQREATMPPSLLESE